MENIAYYNGQTDLIENIKIPLLDRAVYFGDGCYDALYSRNYHPYCLEPHLDRFISSASKIGIIFPMSKAVLYGLIDSLMHRCDSGDLFIYLQLSRGSAHRSHTYSDSIKPNLMITMTPRKVADTYSPEACITVPDTRFYHCDIKTIDLLPNVMAAQKASLSGAHEAIFYRENGIVTEGSHSNVHAIIGVVFRTHPNGNLILPGIARANILRMCEKLGIPHSETPFTKDELFTADEVMISSSGSFCVPVSTIDGIKVGGRGGVILKALQDALVDEWLCETE